MLDRFEDIKAICDKNEVSSAHRLLGDYDLEEGKNARDTEDRVLINDFLPKARDLITLIKKMEISNNTIKDLTEQMEQEARGDKEKITGDMIQKIIIETQQCQQQINTSLTDMSQSVDKAREDFSKDPECRVMASIHSTLLIKFREVLLAFQQSQTDYKTSVQMKIKRQIAIVKPEAPEEEINELAKDPEAASKLLSDQISGKVHRKLQNAVDDIQSKFQVILKLEK